MIRIVQSWDDGVVEDVRLTKLLRKYRAFADFNLVPGLYSAERSWGWRQGERDVWRLGRNELTAVYEGFDIASHSMSHPDLTRTDHGRLWYEIRESKRVLEEMFQREVPGFCYPFNAYNERVIQSIREAGYRYARGSDAGTEYPPAEPLVFSPTCHFLAEDFWDQYRRTKEKDTGVFYFWGHSYELTTESMWEDFERKLAEIEADDEAEWGRLQDLF